MAHLCNVKFTGFISSLILVTMIGFSANNFYEVVNYVVNFDTISEELCENKDSDITECNGMCYLADQLVEFVEVKNPNNDFTMNHIQLNLDFHFYFFQEIDQLVFDSFLTANSFQFICEKTFSGYFEKLVPPPNKLA